jgi:hypothetical protein
MKKIMATYYAGVLLIVIALNLGELIATKNNTDQGKNESPPTSYQRASQGSQLMEQGRSGGGGR